ncbi:MAG TPA: winged helix-turn-helix transcriptional regulator [Candidatus Limnocylindrales bacterium]|nr:winged helix-turn-helix transcriptional regulator [Candidatus Limnocylindrales bacterium]
MPRATWIPETHCAIAQSLGVLGDAWDLLLIRDLARGHHRFEELTNELGISRKILTERLRKLLGHNLIERRPYSRHPLRHEYRLTPAGLALTPILVALQDWGDSWLLGDGSVTGLDSTATTSRVSALAGTKVPVIELPSTHGGSGDVVAQGLDWTVLFGYPLASLAPQPPGFAAIPGALGCTLENRLFRDAHDDFRAVGAAVRGVSTQSPDDQKAFSNHERVPFPLLSDAELRLTAALRLPTFRVQLPRLRRVILIIDRDRTVTDVLFPITDVPAAVRWAFERVQPGSAGSAVTSPVR